jgi:hypothetical protein
VVLRSLMQPDQPVALSTGCSLMQPDQPVALSTGTAVGALAAYAAVCVAAIATVMASRGVTA